jgi:hypothetical protein
MRPKGKCVAVGLAALTAAASPVSGSPDPDRPRPAAAEVVRVRGHALEAARGPGFRLQDEGRSAAPRLRVFPYAGFAFRSRTAVLSAVGGGGGLIIVTRHRLRAEPVFGGGIWGRLHGSVGVLGSAMAVGLEGGGYSYLLGLGPGLELPPEGPEPRSRPVRASLSAGPGLALEEDSSRTSLFVSLDAEAPLALPAVTVYLGFSGHLTPGTTEEGALPSRFGVIRAGIGVGF